MVYAYIRVSTDQQSGSSQRYEIRRWTEERGLTVDVWKEEAISGTIPFEQRVLGKVIKKMGKGDMLICTEISRLGRNMLMIMSILNECSSRGVQIHTIKDNFDLSNSINSKIIAFAFALAAEIERNLISQRTKEALANKKALGVQLGRPQGSSRKKDGVMKDKGRLLQMLDSGTPILSIARYFGVSRNTIVRYIKEVKGEEL